MFEASAHAGKERDEPYIVHHVRREFGHLYAKEYSGKGPAFVVMHGLPDNCLIYEDLIPYLVAAGRRVIAFDFLGFGASDKVTGAAYSFRQQLDDLLAVADALDLDRIVPVAHDSSGPAALNFAIEYPHRLDSLVILNSAFAEAPTGRWPELIELFANKDLKALAAATLKSPEHFGWILNWQRDHFKDSLLEAQKARYTSFLGPVIDDNFRRQGAGAAFAQMSSQLNAEVARNTGRWADAESIEAPVQIIWGQRDPYLNSGVAETLFSHLEHASIDFLDAGHWVQIDCPQRVAAIMLGEG